MIKKRGYDNVSLNVMLSFGSKEIEWLRKIPRGMVWGGRRQEGFAYVLL